LSELIRVGRHSDWMHLWHLLEPETGSPEAFRERYQTCLASEAHGLLVVPASTEGLAGYAWAQNQGADLRTGRVSARFHDLYVSSECRGQGLGQALFAAIQHWARTQAIDSLYWWSRPEAQAFYLQLGFKAQSGPYPGYPFFELQL